MLPLGDSLKRAKQKLVKAARKAIFFMKIEGNRFCHSPLFTGNLEQAIQCLYTSSRV